MKFTLAEKKATETIAYVTLHETACGALLLSVEEVVLLELYLGTVRRPLLLSSDLTTLKGTGLIVAKDPISGMHRLADSTYPSDLEEFVL